MNNPRKILLADDHQIVLDGIKSILLGTDYIIAETAGNGQEAINFLNSHPDSIDILITDISMPLLSGIELCKIVKHQYPVIKVLILSMYNSAPMVKEAIQADADGFLLKTAGKDELLRALHSISDDGTYYSGEIIPLIYHQMQKEKVQKENLSNLTEREREILSLITRELTSEEIAEKLFISKKTVDNHRAKLLEKTNSKSTIGLVKFAIRNGID